MTSEGGEVPVMEVTTSPEPPHKTDTTMTSESVGMIPVQAPPMKTAQSQHDAAGKCSGLGVEKSGEVAKANPNVEPKVQSANKRKDKERPDNGAKKKLKDAPSKQSKVPQTKRKLPASEGVVANICDSKVVNKGLFRDTRCSGRTPSQGGSNNHHQHPLQGINSRKVTGYKEGTFNKAGRHPDWRNKFTGTVPDQEWKKYYPNCQDGRNSGRNPAQEGKKAYPNHQDGRNSGRNLAQVGTHQHGNSNEATQNSNSVKPRKPGYRALLELSQKDPAEVVLVVANTREGYHDLLKEKLQPDLMILVVKVLAKVCEVDFKENKTTVLASACNPKFLENLAYYIATIPTDTNPTRKKGVQSFLKDLLVFCGTVINLLPNTACEHLGPTLMLIKGVFASASAFQSITFSNDLIEKQAELEKLLKKLMEEREKKPVKESSKNETLKYQPPPDDFRELSIFPLPEDILTREKAFVRPNIVEGAYDSIEHYLDVQFRLLREDFVWPLREGITDYMQQIAISQKPNKKTNNIRIYQNVTFLRSTVEKDKVGFVVQFDTKSTSFVNWEHSKRFMFGSLLCFTHDNFASIMFGTILDRKVGDLKHGRITVELTHETEMLDLFHSKFTMVESEVYFEPYYHVLKAIQVMKAESFPMSRYIVHVVPETNPPQYTQEALDYLYNIEEFQVPVLAADAWPIAEDLALDQSQYQAFKSALTKEFVVIQGPPGTGKTYLGLKIASTIINNIQPLLENAREQRHSPLLVVCFTNHALDQFLEGLLPTTKNMVRVGGQSRSNILQEYNLREKRRAHKRQGYMYRLTKNITERMSGLMSTVKGIQEDIEHLDSNYGIVSLMSIKDVYRHANVMCFIGDDGKLDNNLFLDWLVGEEDFFYDLPVKEENEDQAAPEEVGQIPEEEEAGQLPGEEEWNRGPQDGFDLDDLPVERKLRFFISLPSNQKAAEELRVIRKELRDHRDPALEMKVYMMEMQAKRYKYISEQLKKKSKFNPEAARKLMERNVYLWRLTIEQRWTLYFAWVARLRTALLEELRRTEMRYRAEALQYQETRHMEDLKLIRDADVVGMTTTGAARLQPLLQALKCRVVIVEEAAEVMESHIVVSLTSHCQHLILIGDHQQLRPTTAVYKLARDFHFDISLFERMLRNGLHCEVLKVQHRMRPEIASLIVPSIYKELYNHESVLQYKPVQGVTKSLFFLTHSNKEQEIGETHSRRNTFEADMLIRLCHYLLLQGYPPERITILATYSGQMFYLRNISSSNFMLLLRANTFTSGDLHVPYKAQIYTSTTFTCTFSNGLYLTCTLSQQQ